MTALRSVSQSIVTPCPVPMSYSRLVIFLFHLLKVATNSPLNPSLLVMMITGLREEFSIGSTVPNSGRKICLVAKLIFVNNPTI